MPDARGGYGAESHAKIIAACEKHFDAHKDNCSGFVKAVVNELTGKILLTGQANDIYDQLQKSPWLTIGTGLTAQIIAGAKAAEGELVIAATKSQGHGHVAVIVDTNTANKTTSSKAIGYWGRLGSAGHKYMPISHSWSPAKFDTIFFAYYKL